MDNCANVHIWNDLSDFIPGSYVKFNATSNANVSAVNGASNAPEGVGNVELSWKDDSGKIYKIVLLNVLHFPNSPVKILSVVALADQLKDDWDTWILSRRKQSLFTWDFGKFCTTIIHGTSKLPELTIKTKPDKIETFNSLVTIFLFWKLVLLSDI